MSAPIPQSKPKASQSVVRFAAQDAWDDEHEALPLPDKVVLERAAVTITYP